VGTIILVALAVIFLPDFLDGKKEKRDPLFESVPAIPAKKPIINPEPFPSERVEERAQRPIEVISETSVDEDADLTSSTSTPQVKTAAAPAKPSASDLASQTVIERPQNSESGAGWVVQLGSFRHQKNVRVLLEKLENAGYRAFSRPIRTQSGLLTKVFVGPDLQKNKLEAALPHLKELTDLDGKVTRFTVQP
jgi:DedD protein